MLAWPIALSLSIVALAGRASPIVDSSGQPPPPGVTLELPAGYVAMSPLSRTLDALTMLSNEQSVGFFIAIAVVVPAVLVLRRSRSRRQGWVRALIGFAGVVLVAAVLEATVIFAPRPMAFLEVADSNVVTVDFHAHTRASGDANQRFTAEDRRDWHRDGGFDIGYISDHRRFGGALEAARRNPALAGDGVSELSAVEARYHRIISTIMLGLTAADSILLDRRGNLVAGTPASGRPPVTIVAIPNRSLDSVTLESVDSLPRFAGLELIDAAPRGLGQLDREEEKIRKIAADVGLILVSSSNNHGYGRAVAAWNLMTIPGWRRLTPDSVGRLIEQPFRERRLDAVTIVKRLRPGNHGAAVLFTLPVMIWQTVTSLTVTERAVWILWIWIGWGLACFFSRANRGSVVNA